MMPSDCQVITIPLDNDAAFYFPPLSLMLQTIRIVWMELNRNTFFLDVYKRQCLYLCKQFPCHQSGEFLISKVSMIGENISDAAVAPYLSLIHI